MRDGGGERREGGEGAKREGKREEKRLLQYVVDPPHLLKIERCFKVTTIVKQGIIRSVYDP